MNWLEGSFAVLASAEFTKVLSPSIKGEMLWLGLMSLLKVLFIACLGEG
jgi:hypothetical protein